MKNQKNINLKILKKNCYLKNIKNKKRKIIKVEYGKYFKNGVRNDIKN